MKSPWLVAILVASTAMAGCTEPTSTDPAGIDESADDEAIDDVLETILPDLQEPVTQTWFLHAGGLSNETVLEGSMRAVGGFSTFATATTGGGSPLELLSPPVERPTLLLPSQSSLKLFLRSDAPGVVDPSFGYVAWLGSTQSMPVLAIEGGGAIETGEPFETTIAIDWGPRLPVYIPAGESIRLLLFVNMNGPSDAGMVDILIGGDTASAVTLATQEYNVDPVEDVTELEPDIFTGTLHGADGATCTRVDGVSQQVHSIEIASDAAFLHAASVGKTPAGPSDLDLDVYDGTRILGGGHTPSADEGIHFAGEAMEEIRGKTLRLEVRACQAADLAYEVVVTQGIPASQTDE